MELCAALLLVIHVVLYIVETTTLGHILRELLRSKEELGGFVQHNRDTKATQELLLEEQTQAALQRAVCFMKKQICSVGH